jgi:hypothetical protein
MNTEKQQPGIPPLAALVYRFGKGCRQYAFEFADDLAALAARHPYKNEQLRVMPVKDRKFLGDRWVPAAEAAEFVRTAQGQNVEFGGCRPEQWRLKC